MLILRVLATRPLHGYAIAQRIAQLSHQELSVEEGSLYPALQKLLLKGWVKAAPAVSDTGRAVREYRLTPRGRNSWRFSAPIIAASAKRLSPCSSLHEGPAMSVIGEWWRRVWFLFNRGALNRRCSRRWNPTAP